MTNRVCRACNTFYLQKSSGSCAPELYCSIFCQGDRKKHKYNARPCVVDGITFPSKLERDYYLQLQLLEESKQIQFFLRQVGFDLPGNTKYRVDFMIVNLDGSIEFVDCKGFSTPLSRLKIKQVEHLYPVTIKIVKKV